MMKRLICAALALSLMGTTAASARSWNRGHNNGPRTHYSTSHRGWHGDRHDNGNGVGIALGIGLALFGIAAIASVGDDGHDRYYYRAPPPPPPPPPPVYYGGYGYGYGPYGY